MFLSLAHKIFFLLALTIPLASSLHASEPSTPFVLVITHKGWCQGAYLEPGVVLTAGHCHKLGTVAGVTFDRELFSIIRSSLQNPSAKKEDFKNQLSPENISQFHPALDVHLHQEADLALVFFDPTNSPLASPLTSLQVLAPPNFKLTPQTSVQLYRINKEPTAPYLIPITGELLSSESIGKDYLKNHHIPTHQHILLLYRWDLESSKRIMDQHICVGDSGAPVYSSQPPGYILGIVSHSPNNATEFLIGKRICTSLATVETLQNYNSWIQKTINQYKAP